MLMNCRDKKLVSASLSIEPGYLFVVVFWLLRHLRVNIHLTVGVKRESEL